MTDTVLSDSDLCVVRGTLPTSRRQERAPETPTAADLVTIRGLVAEAIRAGAAGFSTSRTLMCGAVSLLSNSSSLSSSLSLSIPLYVSRSLARVLVLHLSLSLPLSRSRPLFLSLSSSFFAAPVFFGLLFG